MARFYLFQLLNGLTTGALLFFVASGLSVIFGLMRTLNLAHGALFLFGGYVGYSVQLATGRAKVCRSVKLRATISPTWSAV